MKKIKWYKMPQFYMALFALLNIFMYFALKRFWIGGSSFLPMIGILGKSQFFFYAFLVNMGVIIGSFISAVLGGEFMLRNFRKDLLFRGVLGGFLIGVGITLAPGTCTTAFVVGIPMLSVSSFLSLAGIILGAYFVYLITWRSRP